MPSSCTLAWSSSGLWLSARSLAMITSVLALAESISARRSASVSCRGSAQSLRAASRTAPRSTRELVVSATKCSAESEDGRWICALMSCSAYSLSSMKVLTSQQCGTGWFCAAYHHAFVIKSPVMLSPA
jgi:hypothetical protein